MKIINNIRSIKTNWRQVDGGEDYDFYTVGENAVQRIDFNEIDKSCHVQYKDGDAILLFNINQINYHNENFR